MNRYISLLRGINISGKNKISMSELKKGFEELDFENVKTHLNSGNIIFSSDACDKYMLSNNIKSMIRNRFDLDIPVLTVLQEEIKEQLSHAPDWWGDSNKEIYDNIIFLIPPLSYEMLYNEIGHPKEEYEKVYNYKDVVFWSFSRKDYQKTNWWRETAKADVCNKITIRTANTVRKIVCM